MPSNQQPTYIFYDVPAQIVLCVQFVCAVAVQNGWKNARMSIEEVLFPLNIPRLVRLQPVSQQRQPGGRPFPQGASHCLEDYSAHVDPEAAVVEFIWQPLC